MKLLIDSSTNYLYLALYENQVIDVMTRNGKNDHSETLIDSLDIFLKRNTITTKDIDAVLVGRGPGSYTGVRISGTIAKVLALIENKKLYSFSTLDLLLMSHYKENITCFARIVAKKNHSYYKVARIENNNISFLTNDSFDEDSKLDIYKQYLEINVDDNLFKDGFKLATGIMDLHLYQEEDVFTYVPNYLRSEING